MKRAAGLAAVILFVFLFPCRTFAQDCPLWVGTWQVKNTDDSIRIWKIYSATSETGSSVILCKAFGVSQAQDGSDQKPLMILYIKFTKTYSYTEETDLAQGIPSTELDVDAGTSASFIARPNGQYPIASGTKTSSEVPLVTTTTIQPETTTTTTAPACPAVKTLGDEGDNIESLRSFRDSSLSQTMAGRALVRIYYSNADIINDSLDRSPLLRAFTKRALRAIAPVLVRKQD